MVWYTFGPFSAYDPTQDGAAKASTFTVYDESDTANSTPLVTQNLGGLTTPVTSDSDGVVAAFRVEDHPAVKIVSGSYSIPAYSVKDMRDATQAAQASAASSAASAASTASSVAALDSWVKLGVTRYNLVTDPHCSTYTGASAGWAYVNGGATATVARNSGIDTPDGRTGYLRASITAATDTGGSSQGPYYRQDGVLTGEIGSVVTVSMYVRSSFAMNMAARLDMRAAGASTADSTSSASVFVQANTWTRFSVTLTATAGFDGFQFWVRETAAGAPPVGATVDATMAMASKGSTLLPYFDGGMTNTDLKGYQWSGTPNASTSQMIDYTVITNAATAQAQAAQDAAEDAQTAAEAAQSSAASLASGVVRKVNGVSPNALGEVTVSGGGSGSAVTSVAGKTGAVSLVKGDVGLGQVDNTSDANKPVSTAQATALAGKANSTHPHAISDVTGLQSSLDSKRGVNDAIAAGLITSGTVAPARLGTGTSIATKFLRGDGTWQTVSTGGGGTGAVDSVNGQTGVVELGAADVGALPDTYTAPVTSVAGLTGDVILNKNNVGLENVDNTADSAKPVSGPQAAAISAKADDSTVVHKTGNETVAGTKTFSSAPVVPDGAFTQQKVSGLATALAAKADTSALTAGLAEKVGGVGITNIVKISQAAYDALSSPDATTLYVIVG